MSFLLKMRSFDCFAGVHLAPKGSLWGEWRACRGLGTAHGSTAKGRAKYHTLEVPVGPSIPVAQSSLIKVLGHSF